MFRKKSALALPLGAAAAGVGNEAARSSRCGRPEPKRRRGTPARRPPGAPPAPRCADGRARLECDHAVGDSTDKVIVNGVGHAW